ncbi:hypothetical protein [Peterkaempfera bronchialis]|uniref:Uncharacterized protein n=1 Tax=Peterkaempfera bronchialis TaxID=2126346 RepID=A0A345SWZ6_9ACTN|nr:hypothetical protein [Peterkaempfera bronchialis]AXI78251.1 hypothetical protein C7M71_013175 [Peterkaempfera bronchialis]
MEYDELADGIYGVFRVASNLAPPKTPTGCREHPRGAVDPVAPAGWSRCLLCNDRRRKTNQWAVPQPMSQAQATAYPVPLPPYTYEGLRQHLRAVNDLVWTLDLTSPEEDFATLADAVYAAFVVCRELARPRRKAGCDRHPGAPLDPTAEPGQECLFCIGAQRRSAAPSSALRRRP